MRGAWKTNNLSMGGSFLSYTIVDEEQGKIFYAEGFVYYPNEAHRSSLREIETILNATSFEKKTPKKTNCCLNHFSLVIPHHEDKKRRCLTLSPIQKTGKIEVHSLLNHSPAS